MGKVSSARAPGKQMLFGEHAVVYGRPCIVTAVDAYMEATVTGSDEFLIEAPDLGFRSKFSINARHPKEIIFAASAVEEFYEKTRFFE